jgi:DNA-directed RNA polymerase specialized sigma24 family protein
MISTCQNAGNLTDLSDKEFIDAMLSNDRVAIRLFFFEKCTPVFAYITRHVFNYQVNKNELINELYLYLQHDDWHKLRQFDYRSKLTTWVSVVAVRFFQKKRAGLIENETSEMLLAEKLEYQDEQIYRKLDVEGLMNRLSSKRYRMVIHRLILKDEEPQELAAEMGITVDNLYNVKRRALQQMGEIIKSDSAVEKSSYYDIFSKKIGA